MMATTYSPLSLPSLFGLQGRVALVPGGYGDIGSAIVRGLALAGARVAVAGRSDYKAQALAATLCAEGHDALGLAMDAHRVADITQAVDAVAAHFGRLDLLVNCVGMQREQRLDAVSEEAFDELLQVNLKAAMFLAQATARHQVAAVHAGHTPGRQVHILSVRAMLGMRDRGYSAYCATKGALLMLIKQHAVELSAHGICVNGVAPTVVRTEMARHWLENRPRGRRSSTASRSAASPTRVMSLARRSSCARRPRTSSQARWCTWDGGITASR